MVNPHDETPVPVRGLSWNQFLKFQLLLRIVMILPLPGLLAAVFFQLYCPSSLEISSKYLLFPLNLVFLVLISIFVSILSAGTFLGGGHPSSLFLGTGVLLFGMSGLFSSVAIMGGLNEVGIKVFNIGALFSGSFNFAAALWKNRSPTSGIFRSLWIRLLVYYTGAVILIAAVFGLSFTSILPTFFIEGAGQTGIRQIVLGLAILSFGVSSVLVFFSSKEKDSFFRQWYGLGLSLIATGLFGVMYIKNLDSLLSWVGRISQYLGGLYLLAAIVTMIIRNQGIHTSLWSLEEMHSRYTTLVDTNLDAISVLTGGKFAFLNPAACRLFGTPTPAVLQGKSIVDFIHPDFRKTVELRIRSDNPDSAELIELIVLKADGTLVDVEGFFTRIRFEGSPSVQVVLRDISVRKTTEREIGILARFSLENPDPVLRADLEGAILFANDASAPLLRYWETEAGRRIPPEHWIRILTCLNGGADKQFEIDTDTFSFLVMVTRGNDGREINLYARNVTEEKRMASDLRTARDNAEAANRAKSEFLAHMSHELRTPISGIIGMIDLLTARTPDPEQHGFLAMIKESADGLLSIIGDILDLSRIESGVVELHPEEFQVGAELERICAPFTVASGGKPLEFRLRIADTVPLRVKADKDKISQVLRNLVSNAWKYTERGEIVVAADGAGSDDGKTLLRLSVRDTGIGIPEEKLSEIFQSFVRIRESVDKKTIEGTGLGLTISKRLTDILGGTLTVSSRCGSGSTFLFTVPVEVIRGDPSQNPGTAEGIALRDLRPLSFLVAEDNRINRLFLEMTLKEAGHRVTTAGNGKELLDILLPGAAGEFDMILMDIQMPIMDGIEAARRIRSSVSPVNAIPIIALTAFAMKDDAERFKVAGMNGYVTKPVNWKELSETVWKLVT